MKKLGNTEAELKKELFIKKSVYLGTHRLPKPKDWDDINGDKFKQLIKNKIAELIGLTEMGLKDEEKKKNSDKIIKNLKN